MRLAARIASIRKHPLVAATIAGGCLVHLWALLYFVTLPRPTQGPPPAEPFLQLTRPGDQGDVLRDQALLQDSAPLFLPTAWNTAPAWQEGVETLPDPNLFEAFPDEVALAVESMRPADGLTPPPQVDLLRCGAIALTAPLGTAPRSSAGLPRRSAYFEIRCMASGALVARGDIQGADALENAPRIWQPAAFLLRFTAEGMMGLPLQSQSSGSDEVDALLGDIVRSSPKVRSLPPGYYSLTIGP